MFIRATFAGILLYFITVINADCGVISRADWGASPPLTVDYLPRPVDLVIVLHSDTVTCLTFESCSRLVRNMQTNHMEETQPRATDILFNFVVGGYGEIFEGRGWLHAGGAEIFPQRAITIAFTGQNNGENPTVLSFDAVKTLLSCGLEQGHLTTDYHVMIRMHPDDKAVEKIVAEMRQWPHISSKKNFTISSY